MDGLSDLLNTWTRTEVAAAPSTDSQHVAGTMAPSRQRKPQAADVAAALLGPSLSNSSDSSSVDSDDKSDPKDPASPDCAGSPPAVAAPSSPERTASSDSLKPTESPQ